MASPSRSRRVWLASAVAAAVLPLSAQTLGRAAVTLDVLLKYAGFFHGRAIALVVRPVETDGVWRVPVGPSKTFLIVPREGALPDRVTELRGTFVDVARLIQDRQLPMHPELSALVQPLTEPTAPARDTLFALLDATWTEPPHDPSPSLRQLVLAPSDFDERPVTVRGRFRAQNLFGDLPAWPRQSRWDFVLQTADASLWVTNLRPKGRGFDLDPTSRRSAGTWLEVSGTLHVDDGLPRLEARTIALSEPVEDLAAPPAAPAPPEPPPTVIFTAPADGEPNIPRSAKVQVQFSRDMAADSFAGHVQVAYRGEAGDAVPAFTAAYLAENRGLEIRFAYPLATGASVTVSLTPGITASDGAPLSPTQFTFIVER